MCEVIRCVYIHAKENNEHTKVARMNDYFLEFVPEYCGSSSISESRVALKTSIFMEQPHDNAKKPLKFNEIGRSNCM